MDQKVLAGIGNIQAAEALYLARVDPRRRVGELASEDFQKILDAIRRSIAETLELEHGSTITYVQEDPGQSKFRVYGRAGKPCLECGSLLQTYKIAGRSTVSCPRCQS